MNQHQEEREAALREGERTTNNEIGDLWVAISQLDRELEGLRAALERMMERMER